MGHRQGRYDPQDDRFHYPPADPASTHVLSVNDGLEIGDPDPATVERCVRGMDAHNWYCVLSGTGQRGEYYVQTALGEKLDAQPGRYKLEHRDGDTERHHITVTDDLNAIVAAFHAVATGEDGWKSRFGRERLVL